MKSFQLLSLATLLVSIGFCVAQQTLSVCEQHAARERRLNNPLTLIPECEADGTYKSTQCHPPSVGGKRFCQCWAPDGSIITSPSQKTKACECHRKKFESMNRNGQPAVGAFIPQCAEDGTFQEKQCHGSTGHCWCVDPITGIQKSTSTAPGTGSTDLNCVTTTTVGRRG